MLEKLRWQELKTVILKASDDIVINHKKYRKGQPILIIDEPSLSTLSARGREVIAHGRGYEGSTNIVDVVSFDITDGYVLFNLWNMIYGTMEKEKDVTITRKVMVELTDDDTIELLEEPSELFLYLIDEHDITNGVIKSSEYTINGKTMTLNTKVTGSFCIIYTTTIVAKEVAQAKQMGQNLVLDLEVLCNAMNPINGDKYDLSVQFDNVNVSTDLLINFNSVETIAFTPIHCQLIPETATKGINKDLFRLIVL